MCVNGCIFTMDFSSLIRPQSIFLTDAFGCFIYFIFHDVFQKVPPPSTILQFSPYPHKDRCKYTFLPGGSTKKHAVFSAYLKKEDDQVYEDDQGMSLFPNLLS